MDRFYTQQEEEKDMNMAVYTETEMERNEKNSIHLSLFKSHFRRLSVSHINDTLPNFL